MFSKAARVILAIGWAIAGSLTIGIAIVVLDVNEDQSLVAAVLDVGRFFADPFRQIVELDDNDQQIAINWGIAAVVYVALAAGIAALIRMAGRRRDHPAAGSKAPSETA